MSGGRLSSLSILLCLLTVNVVSGQYPTPGGGGADTVSEVIDSHEATSRQLRNRLRLQRLREARKKRREARRKARLARNARKERQPTNPTTGFQITLVNMDTNKVFDGIMKRAAARWEKVLQGDLPNAARRAGAGAQKPVPMPHTHHN